jgi:hypothetical protein
VDERVPKKPVGVGRVCCAACEPVAPGPTWSVYHAWWTSGVSVQSGTDPRVGPRWLVVSIRMSSANWPQRQPRRLFASRRGAAPELGLGLLNRRLGCEGMKLYAVVSESFSNRCGILPTPGAGAAEISALTVNRPHAAMSSRLFCTHKGRSSNGPGIVKTGVLRQQPGTCKAALSAPSSLRATGGKAKHHNNECLSAP